jgi:hypothetical protein
MTVQEFSAGVQGSEQFKNASLETKIQMRQGLLPLLKQDPIYAQADSFQKLEIEKKFMTAPMNGLNTESLVNGDDQDLRSAKFLEQAESAWLTGQSSANFGDGFMETFSDYLVGKVGTWTADLFTKGDTTEYIYGDRSDDYKRYRDYVFDTLNPEGLQDFRVGRVTGHITGFASDALATTALYGSIGAPGLIGKAFGGFGSKLAEKAALTGTKGLLAKAPIILGQMGVETFGYLGESAIANAITGELDKNTTFQEYLKTVPGDLGRGFTYFAVGELLGAGLARSAKGLGSVFTNKGFRDVTKGDLKAMSQSDLLDRIVSVAKGDDGAEDALTALLRSGGWEDGEILKHVERARDVRIAADFNLKPDELEKKIFKEFYGMDIEKVGDAYKVSSFGGTELPEPRMATSMSELKDMMADMNIDFTNKSFVEGAKYKSDMLGKLELSVKSDTGERVLDMNPAEVSAIFRPTDELVKIDEFDRITKLMTERTDIEIKPVDDYFQRGIKTKANSSVIYVPTKVTTAEQASLFSKQFFNQMKAYGNGIELNTKNIQAMLRGGSNIRYDEDFLKLLAGRNQFRNIDGKWVGQINGKPAEYANVEDAAREMHMSLYTEHDVNLNLAENLGLTMKYKKGGGIDLLDSGTNKVVKSIDNYTDVFRDPMTRPPLPFEMREAFVAFKITEGAGSKGVIASGTLDDVIAKSNKFAKTKAGSIDRKATHLSKVNYDPQFKKFEVLMKDSGIRREFDTLEAAENFLKKDLTTYKGIVEAAEEAGYRVRPNAGGYSIITDGTEIRYARDLDELAKQVGALDSVSNLTDALRDVPQETLDEVTRFMNEEGGQKLTELWQKMNARKDAYKGFGENRVKRFYREWWQPIRQRLEAISDPVVLRDYNKLESADKAFQSTYTKIKSATDALFHGKGRNYTHAQLRNMGDIMAVEADPAMWRDIAKAKGIELTDQMEETMQSVRDIFDTYGKRFGVPMSEWIDNYQSRISNLSNSKFEAIINKDVMNEAMGTPSPSNIDAFFEHVRIEDYTQGRFQDNIESILDTYLRVGLRKEFLGSAINSIKTGIDGKLYGKEAGDLLKKASDQVAGRIYSSERAEEVAKRVLAQSKKSEAILNKEGKWANKTLAERELAAAQTLNQNYTSFAQALVTSSLMAGKLRMPIRNIAQVWNIGSTLAGSEYILRGQKFMGTQDQAVALYKELYNLGIIKPRNVVENIQTTAEKFVKNLNEVGMNNFYHSDDYTRMVMSVAMRERFKDSLALLRKGDIGMDDFLKTTKASWLNEADQTQLINLMQKGDHYAAETLMMRRGTQMTMFEYDIINKPEKLNTGIGKIWGQYGTYSSQYTQFVQRGAKIEGAAFLAKLALATASVGLFYSDILGVKGMSILPTNTMMFGGSPAFGAISSVSNQISSGNLNPLDIAKEATMFVPLWGISKQVAKGFEDIAEGQYADGLIRFTGSTPQGDKKNTEKAIDWLGSIGQ